MIKSVSSIHTRWVAITTAVAWFGFYIHNIADLPNQSLLSPETGLPTIVTLTVFFVWWRFPCRQTMWLVFGWALLNLIGGALSIIPLPFLQWYPEQSLRHTLFHVVYATTQIPLVLVARSWLHGS